MASPIVEHMRPAKRATLAYTRRGAGAVPPQSPRAVAVEQFDGQQAEEDRAYEADLEGPGQVLRPGAEEPEQAHGRHGDPWSSRPPATTTASTGA